MSLWGQWGFQDAASPLIEELIFFHDHAILILVIVIRLVTYAAVSLILNKYTCRSLVEGQEIETIWTIIPAVILVFLALPSLRLLYLLDEVGDCGLTVKTIGHQWYWSYEYSDFLNIEFDSYIIPTDELNPGDFRLLDVDHRVVLPTQTDVRILVTSADVIHSWAIPAHSRALHEWHGAWLYGVHWQRLWLAPRQLQFHVAPGHASAVSTPLRWPDIKKQNKTKNAL